jgi:hypothetical protein
MTRGQLGGTFGLSPRFSCDEIRIARANRDQSPTSRRSSHWRNSPLNLPQRLLNPGFWDKDVALAIQGLQESPPV